MQKDGLRSTGKLFFLSISLLLFSTICFAQSAFDCAKNNCAVPTDKPYDKLVVGTINAIATPEETQGIFHHLRKHGWWQSLPPDAKTFAAQVQPVSIDFGSGRAVTLLMSMEEMRGAPLHIGELGRFAPHNNFPWTKPQPDNPYWVAVGCIVELCAKDDKACKDSYHSAIYQLPEGREWDVAGNRVKPRGITIDNQTMKPVHPTAVKKTQ